MLRRLPVLMVLASLALCGVAQGKATAPKRCPKGQVRVTAKAPCVKPRATRPGAVPVPAALVHDARVRKLAGTKVYAKVRKARAALAALPKVKRAAVRRAAVEGGQWEPIDVAGRPGRSRTTTDVSEGPSGTQRRVVDVTTEMTLKGGGVTATQSVQERQNLVSVSCPDANGVAVATLEYVHVERTEAERGKDRAFTETRLTRRAKVRLQVGDDAEIASIGYQGTVDFETRATGEKTGRYVMTWDAPAGLPNAPKTDLGAAMKADPAAFFAGTYRGPKGERFTAAEVEGLVTMRFAGQAMLEDDMRSILLDMSYFWQSDGNCVDLTVDPKTATLADGQEQTFTSRARVVSDGTPMAGAMDIAPLDGRVDDAHPRMAGGGPVATRFTMGGARDKTTIVFTVQSRRGRATETVEVTRPHGWKIVFTATGSYDQTAEHGGDVDVTTMSLKWTSTFDQVFFDGGTYNPMGTTDMEGSVLKTHGTLGTGSYACTGVPYPQAAGIIPSPAAPDGSVTVKLIPFVGVISDRDKEDCHREGYGGTYGDVESLDHADPYAATVTVTREMLAQPEFVVPVTFTGGFPPNCGEDSAGTVCKDSGTMVGGVRFTRVS